MAGKSKITRVRPTLLIAKLISIIFHPIYYPLLCLAIIFKSTFLEYLGIDYAITVLCLTALFTIIIPLFLTHAYRYFCHIEHYQLLKRHERFVPYMVHLTSYLVLLHIMQQVHVHSLVIDIIIVSILIQVLCTIINFFWKISMHAAGAGALVGFTLIHGNLFGMSVLMTINIAILLCGLVGTSRLILRRHTLAQVNVGALMGLICGVVATLLSAFRGIF